MSNESGDIGTVLMIALTSILDVEDEEVEACAQSLVVVVTVAGCAEYIGCSGCGCLGDVWESA